MSGKRFYDDLKIGILGGGQLGRMLLQAGLDLNLTVSALDPAANAPCAKFPGFQTGSLTDYDAVMRFGESLDVLTIEIEHVNAEALAELERKGKKVFPQPSVIKLIQDKRAQKAFYREQGLPTADFVLVEGRNELDRHARFLPAFNKLGSGGYDGRGVQRLDSLADKPLAFDAPGLLEKAVDIDKELSVIVARNERGQIEAFPAVESVYHEQNLVDYLLAPARVSEAVAQEAERLAVRVIEGLGMVGLLAVELFLDKNGKLLVNECAPRPHNSGHHTIEANAVSQYAQLWRAILGLELQRPYLRTPAAMVNLLGAEGCKGPAVYEGAEAVLGLDGAYLHLYGKAETKPHRKMGHVTLLDDDLDGLLAKVRFVKERMRVVA